MSATEAQNFSKHIQGSSLSSGYFLQRRQLQTSRSEQLKENTTENLNLRQKMELHLLLFYDERLCFLFCVVLAFHFQPRDSLQCEHLNIMISSILQKS